MQYKNINWAILLKTWLMLLNETYSDLEMPIYWIM